MNNKPISIIGRVVDVLPPKEGNSRRQQLHIRLKNGKHDLNMALTIWNEKVNTIKVGEVYQFYIGCELFLSPKGNYINCITAYTSIKL